MDALRAIKPRLLSLFALVLAFNLPLPVTAQEADDVQLPGQSDVRIIVDISGSMKDTDPTNLRQPAVRLLARLLPEGATAGVWTFGQYVNMLVPHREVNDQWRDTAIGRSEQINSVALRTNLGKAIEVASDGYYTDGDLSRTHFILLTDGKVDISADSAANSAEEQRILEKIVPDLVARGATFHPVALSQAADTDFLRALATKSGGRYQIAETADALNLAFLEALNTAVPQEQIPIEGDGFTVDDGVREFTALIFWGEKETTATRELELIGPDGGAVSLADSPDNVRWAREAGYDLVTVNDPPAGEWRLNGELGEGSRVTVVSDLRMVVNPFPATFSSERPVDIRIAFFEEQEKITNPDFLGVLDVELTITSEDGRSGTKVLSAGQPPEDGTYRDAVRRLPAAGLYRMDVVADGQTFSRKFSATVGFTVPEGAEPAEPVGEPLGAPQPEAEAPEPVAEQPEPEIAPPIDVSQVEEPPAPTAEQPEPEQPEPEGPASESTEPAEGQDSFPVPMSVIAAAAGGVALFAGVVWVALRQRKKRQEALAEAASEREALEDLEEKPESEPEPEPEPEPEEIPEVTEEMPDDDRAELEAVIDEHEAALKAGDESLDEPEVQTEEDIPVADTLVEEEPADSDEDVPELEDVADPSDADLPEDDDDEEFGLEDFDLSEFDDLPDFDQDDSGLPDNGPKKKPDDKDQKK